MSYSVQLPERHPGQSGPRLDIIDGATTAVQRELRRCGFGGYEASTMSTILALFESVDDGFTFFDVGANIGLYSAACASLFQPSAVVAFEPTPSTAEVAQRIAKANRLGITVEERALGREPGPATLYLSARSDVSNSFAVGFKKATGTIPVEVDTLDRYVEVTGLVPRIVKIDAESYEPEVIAGGRRTIEQARPHLIVEVLNRRGHDHGEELTEAMEGFGYHYYRLGRDVPLEASPRIVGQARTQDRDWLLSPGPLPADFQPRVEVWANAMACCTEATNDRVPVLATVRAVYRVEGWPGVRRGARNRVRTGFRRLRRRGA